MPRKKRNVASDRQSDALLNTFLRSQSIEDYIELRAKFPNERTGLLRKRYGVFDFALHLERETKKYGLSIRAVMGVLDGDPDDTDTLCLQLLKSIAERKEIEAQGATHVSRRAKAAPWSLIDMLTLIVVEAAFDDPNCAALDSFALLLRERLAGEKTIYEKTFEKERTSREAIFLGIEMLDHGETPTVRNVARALNVNPSTVSRWFRDRDFLEQVKLFRELLADVRQFAAKRPKE